MKIKSTAAKYLILNSLIFTALSAIIIQIVDHQFWQKINNTTILFLSIIIAAIISTFFIIRKENKTLKTISNISNNLEPENFLTYNIDDLSDESNHIEIKNLITRIKEIQLSLQNQFNDLKRQLTKAYSISNKDLVTGLNNRNLLLSTLDKVIYRTQREKYYSSFIIIDIDQFKQINDQYSHIFGDKLLKQIAQRIENKIRKSDYSFRFGSDEFVIIYDKVGETENDSTTQVKHIVKSLFEEISRPYKINDTTLTPTFSAGIKVFSGENYEKPTSILQHADIALNQAKLTGRNQSKIFEQEMLSKFNNSTLLENALENALENNELNWVIQPQINMETLKVIGGEVLMRWQHQGKQISPLEFIPLAEQSGKITPMTYWMIESVFDYLNKNKELFEDKKIAINISPLIFNDEFVEKLKSLISKFSINPKNIKLEITENIFLNNIEYIEKIMLKIKSLGFLISLDDFGTGFSSLNHLKSLPIDQLKIDKTFLHQWNSDPKVSAIIKTIIELTENLQIQVIAEGIEYPEQAELLKSLKCISCQGFLYSKPLSKEEFLTYKPI